MAQTWHIQFDLIAADGWLDDGFTLTPAVLKAILQEAILQHAYDDEKRVMNVRITPPQQP